MARRRYLIAAVVLGFLLLSGWAAVRLTAEHALHGAVPASCDMPFASTTSCLVWDQGFREAYYFYVGRGTPVRRACTAFLGREGPAGAFSGRCDFLEPAGWNEQPCRQLGLDEVSRCFVCTDGPDSGGTTLSAVQGLSADCGVAVGIRTGNVRPEAVMPFVRNPTGYPR